MIDCLKCKFYYITWEPQTPNGCRGYGFKSKQLPSQVVLKNSGEVCSIYTPKIMPKKN